MIRLITVGVCALLLAGCSAESKSGEEGGNTPTTKEATKEATTSTSAKFELGKDI
jgi:PBP1b-binding outer membrane lipoprotein LpoB